MMCRKIVMLLVSCFVLGAFAPAAGRAEGEVSPGQVLIIYGAARNNADILYQTEIIRNVQMSGLGTMSVRDDMYVGGMHRLCDYIMLISPPEGAISGAVLSDLNEFEGPILFVGEALSALAESMPKYNIKYEGRLTGAEEMEVDLGHGRERYRLSRPVNAGNYSSPGSTVLGAYIKGGEEIGSWAFKKENLYYVNQVEDSFVAKAAATFIIDAVLGRARSERGLYVKLDYIYPVSNFFEIARAADFLYEQSVPFVYVAMPFYVNEQSAGAEKYGELLRYLSARGGTPIVHCPIFSQMARGDVPDPAVVLEKMNIALKNLAILDIYPLAIAAPEAYLGREDFGEFFSSFSHYFAVKGDGKDVYTVSSDTPFPGLEGEFTKYFVLGASVKEMRAPAEPLGAGTPMSVAESGDARRPARPKGADGSGGTAEPADDSFYDEALFVSDNTYADYAISIPSSAEFEEIKTIILKLKSKGIQFSDFKMSRHSVNLGENHIENYYGAVTYNGELSVEISQPEEPAEEGSELGRRISDAVRRGNLYVVAFSGAAIFILIIAFLIGRKKDKSKFLRRR